ncbi:MAG TPA: adenylate/guanylate cyclase domain-containing protein [Leptospiraceae bacterium]|nr:adenylate/guanylate cyclase domain-containing protein [Leptospiraceae bacterium]
MKNVKTAIPHSSFPIPNYITVPSSWNNHKVNGKPIGKDGFATYRLKVYLDKPLQGLTLKTDHIGTAYKLWVNGRLVTEAGKVSNDREIANPGYLVKPFLLSESYQELDIILQVSNYHDRNGGFWRSFVLGANERIANRALVNHFLSFFLFGCLVLMGIYHLGLYSLRKQDTSALWFGLFSILLSLRPVLVGESILYALLPSSWVLLHKIEYLTVYAALPLFANFVHSIFPFEFQIKIKMWVNWIGFLFSAFVILAPSSYYTQTLVIYQIFLLGACLHCTFVLIKASKKNRMGAKVFLAGWICLFITIINDILHHQLLIYTATLFPLGFFIFIISQAVVLSMRFSQAFNQSEELSNDLQSLTQSLENKIAEGVREQEKYSQCLLELSKSKTIDTNGLESALQEVTEECAKILEIGRCSIWVLNETGCEIKCIDLFESKENVHSKELILKQVDFPNYFTSIKEGAVLSAPDIYSHFATKDFTKLYSRQFDIHSLLDAPIRSGGKLIGIICCEQVAIQKNWTLEEENFIVSLANILASYFELNERQEAFSELTEAKEEIEDLNQFTHLVNSLSSLDDIFIEVSKYAHNKYNIAGTWLFLPDEKRENLYTHKGYSYQRVADEHYAHLITKKIPLKEKEGGMLYVTFKRKKPFYLSRIPKNEFELDREFEKALSIKSFLYIPLVRNDSCIGIFVFSNLEKEMKLSKKDVRKFNNLCSQIAGTVDTNHLLQQVDKARKETEKQNNEADALNKLIKSLNENLNLNHIMQKVLKYVNEKFGIKYFALYIVNSEKESISLLDIYFPDYIIEVDRKKILEFNIPIQNTKGAHAYAIKAKKPYYLSKIKKTGSTNEELFIIEKFNIQSILLIPLLLNNEPIGILDFSNTSKMNLSKSDITKLSILGEQLAGIIYGSNLFKEVQNAKEQAYIERGVAIIAQNEAEQEREKSERLLLNILPAEVANELKEKGFVEPVYFENTTILFTDFKGFTQISEGLTPQELIKELDDCFSQFDHIIERNSLEKLKTIGDSYMCAGGLPKVNVTHAVDSCLAALEIQAFMNQMKEIRQSQGFPYWELRLGIHSGSVIAGVVGEKKFAYDIWGDTVNTASRMESSGTPGKINISYATQDLVKHLFDCESRGEMQVKNKGMVKMYYLNRILPEFSKDEKGMIPNEKFWDTYKGERYSLNKELVKRIQKLAAELNLLVGLQVIDTQHLWLYYLILELEEINANKDSIVVYKELKQISRELRNYATEHFELEEMLLDECKFDSMDSHIKMHRNFSEFMETRISDFHRINLDEIQSIIDYLKTWLQKHILIEDKLYCDFINSTNFDSESFFQKIRKEKKVTLSKCQSDLYALISIGN